MAVMNDSAYTAAVDRWLEKTSQERILSDPGQYRVPDHTYG